MYYNYNTMNNEIKKIVLTSMFIAITGVLGIFQIPIPFLPSFAKIDLAIVPLLLSRKFVGLLKALVIATIYPFFTFLVVGDPIGLLFLIIQSVSLIFFDNALNKNKYSFLGISFTTLIIVSISLLINIVFIYPLYYGGFNGFEIFWHDPWKNILIVTIVTIPLTMLRLVVGYLIIWPLWKLLKEVIPEGNII